MNTVNEFILRLYGEAQNKPIGSFNDYVLAELKNFIKFDSAVFADCTLKSSSIFSIKSLHLHNQPLEKYTERKDWENEQSDPVLMMAYRKRNTSIMAEVKNFPEINMEMLKYAKKYDISQSLAFCASGKNENDIHGVGLWRANDDAFTNDDKYLSDLIFPHIVKAQEINLRHQAIALKSNNLDSISLISGLDCKIIFVDDAAIEMMQCEWPEWHPPLLPKDLIKKLSNSQRMFFKGRNITIQAELHDFFMCLKINKLSLNNNLTSREVECLNWVRLGKTSREIAETLKISERTTNFHITNATHKLGASSRRHAVSKGRSLGLI